MDTKKYDVVVAGEVIYSQVDVTWLFIRGFITENATLVQVEALNSGEGREADKAECTIICI